ncbi:MAG: WD40 repeat domain-containing protein, partial [Planctomycetota bacterium]
MVCRAGMMLRTLALAATAAFALCDAGDAAAAAESRAGSRPRTDLYGDPLPPGAVARIGTVRLPAGGWGRRIAFSPDGEILASCVGAGSPEANLWETGTGRKIRTIRLRGPASINSVDFSPDGRRLAVAGDKVRIYDVRTGRKVREIGGRTLAAFLPDGKRLASWSRDYGGVCLWNLASGKMLRSFPGPVHATTSLAISRDGSILAAVADDVLYLWDLVAGKETRRAACHGRWTRAMAISPDGKTVATGSDEREISLVDVSTGAQLRVLRG